MKNRYDDIVEKFFGSAFVYALNVFNSANITDANARYTHKKETLDVISDMTRQYYNLRHNSDVRVEQFIVPLKTFNAESNYKVYYAYMAVYNAVIRYYRFNAKYNLPDADLENAVKNWYMVTQPKQNILTKVIGLTKKKQK